VGLRFGLADLFGRRNVKSEHWFRFVRLVPLERVPMKSDHLSGVMPALVAGIHVFLAGVQQKKTWMAGTSPAMTPDKWFNMSGRCSRWPKCLSSKYWGLNQLSEIAFESFTLMQEPLSQRVHIFDHPRRCRIDIVRKCFLFDSEFSVSRQISYKSFQNSIVAERWTSIQVTRVFIQRHFVNIIIILDISCQCASRPINRAGTSKEEHFVSISYFYFGRRATAGIIHGKP
jgi:hypothetical protein